VRLQHQGSYRHLPQRPRVALVKQRSLVSFDPHFYVFCIAHIFTEAVVAESVVVIKKLLQTQPSAHREIIIEMAKLVDSVAVPQARASILWLLGEYSERVPKIAPDVLRKMAKSFTTEVSFLYLFN